MLLPPHEFVKPQALADVLHHLDARQTDARLMGGGTDVVYNMRCRLLLPGLLISLRAVSEIDGIRQLEDGSVRIGAATRLTDIENDAIVRARYPALAEASRAVASRHVRNMATLGGNVCLDTRCWYTNQTQEWRDGKGPCLKTGAPVCHVIHGSPTCVAINNADTPPVLLALDAIVEIANPTGTRCIPIREFYRNDGIAHTVREPDDVVTSIVIPPSVDRTVFIKQTARQGMDFAYGVVAARADGRGAQARRVTVVLGSLTSAPLLLRQASAIFSESGLTDAAIEAATGTLRAELGPLTNLYSPAAYKRELARALLRRAVISLREMPP